MGGAEVRAARSGDREHRLALWLPVVVVAQLGLLWLHRGAGVARATEFPIVLECGERGARAGSSGARVLRDLPFDGPRGHGYTGGRISSFPPLADRRKSVRGSNQDGGYLARAAREVPSTWFVRGAESRGRLTWREGEFRYAFRMPRGEYLVEIAAVETDVALAGQRVFDVLAEDRVVLSGVDIVREAGDLAWWSRSFRVAVLDGWLDLRFAGVTADYDPRCARIAIRPWRSADDGARLAAPDLRGRVLPGSCRLEWDHPAAKGQAPFFKGAVAGWRVERAASLEGPFESLTDGPIQRRWLTDLDARPGRTWYYRVTALALKGDDSEASEVVALSAREFADDGFRRYELQLGDASLDRIARRVVPAPVTHAEIDFREELYPLQLSFDTRSEAWRARKSLLLDMRRNKYRLFRKQERVVWSAQAGDVSQLRARLTSAAGELFGVSQPLVEPVAVSLDGRSIGARWQLEPLGAGYRKRLRLDRVGLLVRLEEGDGWSSDWAPRGERLGKGGDVSSLGLFLQQLHRAHPTEIASFFDSHLYVDRWIDRLAYAVLRGKCASLRGGSADASVALLQDSRNGRWEWLEECAESGEWGLVDGSTELWVPREHEIDGLLFQSALRRGGELPPPGALAGPHSTLLTRLLGIERFRELFFARLEGLLADDALQERLEQLIRRLHDEIAPAYLAERDLWPHDGGASFLGAPARMVDAHRERRQRLSRALRARRADVPERLEISALCLCPSAGSPWIEVRHRGGDPVDLSGYRLTDAFERAGRVVSRGRTLRAGETARVEWTAREGADSASAAKLAAGGVFALTRFAGGARRVLCDFVWYGWQTRDVVLERTSVASDDAAGWRFVDASDRAGSELRQPPSIDFRHGVERTRAGDTVLWFAPRGNPTRPGEANPARVVSVELRYRESAKGGGSGGQSFARVPLVRDDRNYRWAVSLENTPGRPETDYWYVAMSESRLERAYPPGAPELWLTLPVLPEVRINEVCPRPGRSEDAPPEFIELYNESDESVSLLGYYLTDDRRRPTKWRIEEDVVLKPKGYAVFYADDLDEGLHTNFRLSNSGEFVGLFTAPERGGLKVDGVAFRGVSVGESWGRKQDGTNSHRVWKHPTPSSRNVPQIPAEALEKKSAE